MTTTPPCPAPPANQSTPIRTATCWSVLNAGMNGRRTSTRSRARHPRCQWQPIARRRYGDGGQRSQDQRIIAGGEGRHESEEHPPRRWRSRYRLPDRRNRSDGSEIRVCEKGLKVPRPAPRFHRRTQYRVLSPACTTALLSISSYRCRYTAGRRAPTRRPDDAHLARDTCGCILIS